MLLFVVAGRPSHETSNRKSTPYPSLRETIAATGRTMESTRLSPERRRLHSRAFLEVDAVICTSLGKYVSCAMLVSLLVLVPAAGWTESADSPEVELSIRRVALFKNGLGFYTSDATLSDETTTVKFSELPVPVFGTFWVGYGKGLKVSQFVARLEEFSEETDVANLSQLLQANVGNEVVLRAGFGGDETIRGILQKFSGDEAIGVQPGRDLRYPGYPVPNAGFVVIQTDSGTVFLDAGMIRRVDFDGGSIGNSLPVTGQKPSLILELEKPARGEEITVSYLAKGATWTPGYLIDLSDPEIAKFHASAVIVNELADFEGVQLELVTGFPNIKFAEVTSPLAKTQGLTEFMSALSGDLYVRGGRSARMGMMLTNVVAYDAVSSRERAPGPSYSSASAGQVSEDLFLYPVDDFSLKKDETAWRPLFSAEMPYEHIYTWKIADFVDAHSRYQTPDESSGGKTGEVWHSCRLTNSLDLPLTTAATEFVTDGQFVGQDVCYYTAPGMETTIRINRAMNVLVDQTEIELKRERQVAKFRGNYYDLVEVRGELEINNKLDKTISLEVVKELSGEVLEMLPEADDVPTAKGLKQTNPRHLLTWELELEPGQKVTLSYRYQVYIVS